MQPFFVQVRTTEVVRQINCYLKISQVGIF